MDIIHTKQTLEKSVLKSRLEEEEDIQGSFEFSAWSGFEEVAPLLKEKSSDLLNE